MNHKASLLGQLRIDRTEVQSTRVPRLWWAGGAIVLVVLAVAGGMVLARPSGIPIQAVAAKPVATSGGAGASLLDASGYVVANLQAAVSAKSIYKVTEILVAEGQHVTKGQVIARLDDSNTKAALAQAAAQVKAAEAALTAAGKAFADIAPIFRRNQDLFKSGWISQEALDSSRALYDADETAVDVARRQLGVARASLEVATRFEDDTVIRAPFAGVVTVKSAQPGQIVSPQFQGGGGIATIVDMDSLEVDIDVSENFISRVHSRQPVTIRLNAYPDWDIPGEVIAVIPTADRAKATVKVRVAFRQKDDRIVPEMGARVSFLEEGKSDAAPVAAGVIVPAEAVQGSGDSGVVFVVKDKVVERRTVKLGAKGPDGQVVLSGLSAGDRLAVGDLSKLQDGTRISVE
jgi:RND family efflux transporter MFP subunit